MKVEWKGVYPAITTKFTLNDELDFDAYDKNIFAQLEAGIDGLILGGSLGEASVLTDEEKFALLQHTSKLVDNKIPLVLNIAEQATKAAVNIARRAEDLGADALMLLPPNITLDMFEELAECSNIEAVKESTRDITNVTRMINRFGDRYKILCGVDPLALESLVLGADGWVAGLVDAFPKETVAIFRLVKAGKIDEALNIYRWFLPVLELDIHPKLVQYIKLAEVMTGIGTETVRAPRLPIEGAEREKVLNIINKALAVRPELPEGSWGRVPVTA